MTIGQALEELEYLHGCTLKKEVTVGWLSRLDGLVNRQLHWGRCLYSPDFTGYDADTDDDTQLLVAPPYDSLYGFYLARRLYDALGETTRSNNAAAQYNAALADYMDHLTRNYPVRCRQTLKLI